MNSKLQEDLKEILNKEVQDYLDENCDLANEDWGGVYKDSDVEKATRVIKEEMIDIINQL